jgi:hypothetical protein
MKPSFSLALLLLSIALLSVSRVSAQIDPEDQLINEKLVSLSSSNRGQTVDCSSTSMYKPDDKVSLCAKTAFEHQKPFRVLYSGPISGPVGIFHSHSAYGLAGDGDGNTYEVLYDSKGLLNLGMGKKSQVFAENRVRVTACVKPVRLGETETGMLACLTPVNYKESQLAARQKPIATTVCAILEHPASFNNKIVRIRGYVSGNFEYSTLGADGCSDSIWFAFGGGEGPPGLVAYVNGEARPGAEDDEGRLILPVPVKLVEDSNFRRFEKLMKARAEADRRSEKSNPDDYTSHRVVATFTGRVDAVPDDVHAFHLKRKSTDRADFLGFGQMGLFDAQFVMQAVEGRSVLEAFPPIPNPASVNPAKSRLTRP